MIALAAVAAGVLSANPAKADDAAVTNNIIAAVTADSWNVWNAPTSKREDPSVQAGTALRVNASKGVNVWDAAGSVNIKKAIKKGDVILGAFWARVETPPEGSTTATLPANIGLGKAPYTSIGSDTAIVSGKWAMYYVSGVADADYDAGALNLGVQLAGAKQVIDLGPAFVLNFGPNYDRSKLPRNKAPVTAAPAPAPTPSATAAPEASYATDLAALQAKLPVKGTLLNAPDTIYGYGTGLTTSAIQAPDVAGGKATRAVATKAGGNTWDAGAGTPINGAIKKGDTILISVWLRAAETPNGAPSATLSQIGVHQSVSPWGIIAATGATLPKGQWKRVTAFAVATADYPAGTTGFGLQLGGAVRTIDIGPVYVLNLGPGVDAAKLPL